MPRERALHVLPGLDRRVGNAWREEDNGGDSVCSLGLSPIMVLASLAEQSATRGDEMSCPLDRFDTEKMSDDGASSI